MSQARNQARRRSLKNEVFISIVIALKKLWTLKGSNWGCFYFILHQLWIWNCLFFFAKSNNLTQFLLLLTPSNMVICEKSKKNLTHQQQNYSSFHLKQKFLGNQLRLIKKSSLILLKLCQCWLDFQNSNAPEKKKKKVWVSIRPGKCIHNKDNMGIRKESIAVFIRGCQIDWTQDF